MATQTILHPWTGEVAAPLQLVQQEVSAEWIDEYGHMNMAHYLTICDIANWAFWNWVNAPDQTMETRDGHEYIIVENHVTYSGELAEGDAFTIETQLTDLDEKRFILFHRVRDAEGGLSATNEVKMLGFNLTSRRPEAWQPTVAEHLAQVRAVHSALPRPEQAGQGIVLKKR